MGDGVLGPGQRPETHLRKWRPGRERSSRKEDSQGCGPSRREGLGSQMHPFLTAHRILI